MALTILAYGRIMGASWNMLLINKWRTTRGRKNPIVRTRTGSLDGFFVSSRPVPFDHTHYGIEWHPDGALCHTQQPAQRRRSVEFRRHHRLFHLRSN